MSSMSSMGGKAEGDISTIFASLSGATHDALPQRFADLKKLIVGDSAQAHRNLAKSWTDLLAELETAVAELKRVGPSIIPEVSFEELVSKNGKDSWKQEVAKRGVVVVRDVVPDEQALAWKEQVREYAKENPQVKGEFQILHLFPGFPADNKQVFEIYWSKSQVEARSHPNLLATQKALMSKLFHADPSAQVSVATPVSYADRLRIRQPGDA
ncbi:hypothetical protein FRB90_008672, partial [Tulasnella sp. 427]